MQYHVQPKEKPRDSAVVAVSAFDVLMNSQKEIVWPDPLIGPINKKQQMWNDFVVFLKEKGLGWSRPMVTSHGKVFITTLCDALWLVDGHWKKFADRAKPLPAMFEKFQGYNVPEAHKKKKLEHVHLDRGSLLKQSDKLNETLQQPWLCASKWRELREAIVWFSDRIRDYADYLASKCKEVSESHKLMHPKRSESNVDTLIILSGRKGVKPRLVERYQTLWQAVFPTCEFQPVLVNELMPTDTRERRRYIDELSDGVPSSLRILRYTHSPGNNVGNTHYVWKIPENISEEELLRENLKAVEQVKSQIKVYHSRAMRNEFKAFCGRASNMKPAIARELYYRFVGDASAAESTAESEVDKRVRAFLDCEDEDIIWDLRTHNAGQPEKYTVFFEHCQIYLNSQADLAADERRHDTIVHMGTAMSAQTLLMDVSKMCPPDTPIPSVKWLTLQFWPKDPTKKSAMQYTGKFKVKYMIQARQFRASHPDAHYASALFRYQRTFAVKYNSFSNYVFLDDKHHCKVGEPGLPVAAVDRGKQVIVSMNTKFQVADHDHTKCSIVPSVALVCDIPTSLDGSFYRGNVHVGIKEAMFEPSSAIRHATELNKILGLYDPKPILLIYSDGGPDHNLTFLATQISYICLFLNRDLDMLSAIRTPPYHSWKNPVERIMSVINIALQCVGLMRQPMSQELEKVISSCKTMKEIRNAAETCPAVIRGMLESVKPVKELVGALIQKLHLKEQPFSGMFL